MINSDSRGSALPLLLAGLAAIAWVAFACWAQWSTPGQPGTAAAWLPFLAMVLAPAAAFLACGAALSRPARQADGSEGLFLEHEAFEAEAQLTGVATRLATIRSGLTDDLARLAEAAAMMDQHGHSARHTLDTLSSATAAAQSVASSIDDRLKKAAHVAETLGERLATISNMAQGPADELEEASSRLDRAITTLGDSAQTTSATLSDGIERLEASAENRIALSGQALDDIGGRITGELENRLTALAQSAARLGDELNRQTEAANQLSVKTERSFQLLDARLAHSQQTSQTILDRLGTRLSEVNDQLSGLTGPLSNGKSATDELAQSVISLREAVFQSIDALGQTLPQQAVDTGRIAESIQAELQGMTAAIDEVASRAGALGDPVAESRRSIEEAAKSFEQQRAAMEMAGHALVVELEQARQLVAEVEAQTRDSSLAAATGLVDALTQVRDVSTQATGTMREMLENLIAETRQSLSRTADEAMRRSFAEPVAARAAEAEQAAANAAERSATSMAALASTLALLEKQTMVRLAKVEEARQQDLLAAASLLSDRLASAGVSIASAMDRPMDDSDWARWRQGERGMFSRRALSLLEKREAREVKELLEQDPDFAANARRYAAEFDALVQRADSLNPQLPPMLLSSDQGRLAAALSELLPAETRG